MGFSKKRLKRKLKQEFKLSPKVKEKRKLSKQIEGRKKHLESKRQAKTAQGSDKKSSTKVSSVDELFASIGEEEDDDLPLRGDDGDSCSESSAGAFHDVDGGDDLDAEDLKEMEEEGKPSSREAQRHEKELQAIRERDPEFYKFLVEEDQQLLSFRADDFAADDEEKVEEVQDAEDDVEEEDFAAVEAGGKEKAKGRLLTTERFKALEAASATSFTAFRAALNAFHVAVRSIGGGPSADAALDEMQDASAKAGDKDAKKNKQKQAKKASKQKNPKNLLSIDGEATFSEVLEWSIANVPRLLKHYAGAIVADKLSKKDKRNKKQRDSKTEAVAASADGLFDGEKLEGWRRVKVSAYVFWKEIAFLLDYLATPEMLEYVLRHCSTPEALCWLWPFKYLRKRFLKRCCSIWASGAASATQSVRLLAFLFIRNYAAMSVEATRNGFLSAGRSDLPQLEVLMRAVLRSFADAASSGYSWRSVSNFRFMENCVLELFRIEDATAYRVGYSCIRQLALILRNACIATSQGTSSGGGGKKNPAQAKNKKSKQKQGKAQESGKKKRAVHQRQVESLISWPFVRALYLWTKAVGTLPSLRPLAYPLFMIIMGAVKTRLTSLQHFPFVFHGLQCLCRLSVSLEAFVPMAAQLLKALSVLLQTMEKEAKNRKKQKYLEAKGNANEEDDDDFEDPKKKTATISKAPEIEVLLRFSSSQAHEPLTLEAVGSSLCALLTDHLGFLSRSPAFPEISAPVLLHLRRHSKHCSSESIRRQLKSLITSSDDSVAVVRKHREALNEPPPPGKLCFLESEVTPLGRQRTQLLKRRATEEKQRVEAEIKDSSASPPPKNAVEAKRQKRKEDRQKPGEVEQPPEKNKSKRPKKVKTPNRAAAEKVVGDGHIDVIEEMDFSGAEE